MPAEPPPHSLAAHAGHRLLTHWRSLGRRVRGAAFASLVAAGLVVGWALAAPGTYVVNNNGDGSDATPGDGICATAGGVCTLRAAIEEANSTSGAKNINFNLPSCPGAGCVIAPASALPAVALQVNIDGSTQPGWTANPIAELRGDSAGSGVVGLQLNAASSTLKGLIVNRFTSHGVQLGAGSQTVQGNWIGTDNTGNAAAANGGSGLNLSGGAGSLIGGSSAAQRNVISGNTGAGISIASGGNTTTIQANYIGLNAAGTAAVANTGDGISVTTATGAVIGGATAGMGNVIGGNGGYAISISSSSGHSVLGNSIGTTADGSAVLATPGSGILVATSTGTTVGGITAGSGNTIRLSTAKGVIVTGSAQAAIRGNSIYGSSGLGIDLANNGVTANDGAKTAGQPNQLMDAPLFTSASLSGANLSVAGYVGSAAGQANFASATVDIYTSDGTSTNGSGQTYLGTLTADGSGNFSGTLSGVAAVINLSTRLTATATDAGGNTSEFGTNILVGALAYGVGGMRMWVDASDVAGNFNGTAQPANGSTVLQLNDKSGNGLHFASTGGSAPTMTSAAAFKLPVLRFTAAQWMRQNANFPGPVTVVYVAAPVTTPSQRILQGVGNNWLLGWWGFNGANAEDQAFYNGWVNQPSTAAIALPRVYTAIVRGAGQNSELWRNGVQLAANTGGVAGPNGLAINTGAWPAETTNADLGEILVFPRVLSPADRQAVEDGLFAKWVNTTRISGTVFEDANYGGGAGRSLAASSGSGASGATVELYNSSGTFVSSTTTAGGGAYSFTGLASGNYFIRVVSSTVRSQRTGSTSALRGVMTYRTTAASGTAVAVTDFVGGTNPALVDPGTASGGAAFNTSTFVYSAGLSGTAQNVTPVTLGASSSISGLDFGFNFSAIVNTNDSGQGSLRQFITNANAFTNQASLAQAGNRMNLDASETLPAGFETSIFMIPRGVAVAGIRAAAANQLTAGVARITVTSVLPNLARANVAIDGSTQTANVGNTSAALLGTGGTVGVDAVALPQIRGPEVQLNGARALASGLALRAANVQVRGLAMVGFANTLDVGGFAGLRIEQNVLGSAATALADPGAGVRASGSHVFFSGSPAGTQVLNNFIGFAGRFGIGTFTGGTPSGVVVSSNELRGNAVENGTLDNIVPWTGCSNWTITGNLVASAVGIGIDAEVTGTGHSIINNTITGNGTGSVQTVGIVLGGSDHTVSKNIITTNRGSGVSVATGATGVRISQNSLYANNTQATANRAEGISLGGSVTGTSVRLNDGAKTAGQANLLMDHPVFTAASLNGNTLAVAGYVGNAAGQTVFAGATVEVFISDNDATGFGEGQTYLGVLTADGSGNFSGSIDVTGKGVANGSTRITGTATDANGNTSEFGANATVGMAISGTVFEDANYGGGAGRSLAASSGSGASGATVELYNSSGVWISATTTASGGSYSFTGLAAATYHVRVVGSTVLSQRSGSTGALVGVMTYRTTAASGTAVAVADQVGGTNPSQVDPAAGSTGATFSTGTGVFSAVLTGTAQAFAPVVVSTDAISGVDFGFNFSAVVNTNPSGQGSLHQALTNANALGNDTALAVAGRTAGVEHVVFMLADGTTRPGLRNTFPSQFAAGIAIITPGGALPSIGSTLVLDAQTQPGWVQDPIVELRGTGAGAVAGLTLSAGASTVRGLIINRYGSHGISITGGTGHTVQGNWVGTDATGAAAAANSGAGISVSTTAVGLQIGGTTAAQRNVLSGNTSHGLAVDGGSALVVQGNYVGTNASGTAAVANGGRGVFLGAAVTAATLGGTAAGAGNVISGNADYGVWLDGGPATLQGNTIGLNAAGTTALANAHGLRVNSSGHAIGGTSTAARNVIAGNTGRGLWLSASGNTVQGNYVGVNAAGTLARPNTDGIYVAAINNTIGGSAAGAGNLVSGNSAAGVQLDTAANGSVVRGNVVGLNAALAAALPNNIGISVACSTGCSIGGTASGEGNTVSGNTNTGVTVSAAAQGNAVLRNSTVGNGGIGIDLNANGVSLNDGAKTGGAGNQLMDHPVFTSARVHGNQLTVAGYVGSAAGQSLFANARVEIFVSDNDASGFGEGSTYLGFVTTDANGNFSSTITMAVNALAIGTRLTATATDGSGNTSEFGANFAGLIVDMVVNDNGDAVDANPGDGFCATAGGVCTLRAAIAEFNASAAQSSTPTVAFALPGCSAAGQAACSIAPGSALPTVTQPMMIDAQTQPGWTQNPVVELNGTGAGTGTSGLVLNASGSAVRGFIINRFNGRGILVNAAATNATIQGNWVGLTATGTAAGNAEGVLIGAAGATVGGTLATQRNVISGSSGNGLALIANSPRVLGNYIGTNPTGLALLTNGSHGIYVGAITDMQIGGTTAAERNVIAGTGNDGIGLHGNNSANADNGWIKGNYIGVAANGSTVLEVGRNGVMVLLGFSNVTIGGTEAGAGNVIAGARQGVFIGSAGGVSRGARILGNSIYGNSGLGIDQSTTGNGSTATDGVTANTGTTNASLPNNGMNFPVFTGAGVSASGTSLTVFGFIGTGSGQAAFAGARVEIFKAAPDATGHGEGQVYLGALTADANGRFSGVLSVTAGSINIGEAVTATATDAAGNTSEFGPNWSSTSVAALLPSKFNVFEPATGAGALNGVIKTKTVGVGSVLDVIAIDSGGAAVSSAFTGSVQLTWLDARDNSGAATADGCRSSWVAGAAAGSVSFTGGTARQGFTLTPPAVGRDWRLRITHTPASGPPVESCSGDNFAVKPSSLLFTAVGDSTDSSTAAGVPARSLISATANQTSGGAVHRAGRPFSLRAAAVDASSGVQAGYDGTPALVMTGCAIPSTGCVAGTLAMGAVAVSSGAISSDTLTYSEVGSLTMLLRDTTFADVDLADSSAAERLVESAAVTVGRFVPDNYTATLATAGVLATGQASCSASGAGYTFVGQAFGWATAPVVQVTARNAAGAVTRNWTGALMKLQASTDVLAAFSASGTAGSTLASALGPVTVADVGSGSVTVARSTADSLVLGLNISAPQPSFTPTLGLTTTVADNSETAVAGNSTTAVALVQSSLGFNAGAVFHYARLKLHSGHGDARVGVRVLAELQRFTTAGWARMAEDQGCISVAPAAVAFDNPRGRFAGAGMCSAPLPAASVPTRGGRAWLRLPPSPGALPGALTLRLNLGPAASGNACSASGVPQAAVSMGLLHLRGAFGGATTLDADPLANATWGKPSRELMMRRERFD